MVKSSRTGSRIIMDDNDRWIMQAAIVIPVLEECQLVARGTEVGTCFDMQIEYRAESGYFHRRMSKAPVTEGKGMD